VLDHSKLAQRSFKIKSSKYLQKMEKRVNKDLEDFYQNPKDSNLTEYESVMKSMTKEEINFIKERTPIKFFKKGTILLREGEVSDKSYFTFEGCVRQYYLMDGIEKTTFFFTEGHSISSFQSSSQQTPSKHYLECVEDCKLSVSSLKNEEEMYHRFPRFKMMCLKESERQLGNYQEMLAHYITSSPEERYLNLLKSRPELLNRVPQHQIASYLGVKPESLSRIRKRISLK